MENIRMFYARVSSKEQNEARQLEEARQLGIEERLIFLDKASGANFEREQFKAMLAFMRSGDEVYISSLDRLGRNYRETAEAWDYITKTKKVHIIVLDMPVLDTRNANDLTGELIRDIVFKLLCYVSERELDNIRARQKAGIAAAKARGAYKGRKQKEVDKPLFEKMCREIASGDRTARSAYKKMGIAPATFYRMRKEYETKTGRWSESVPE